MATVSVEQLLQRLAALDISTPCHQHEPVETVEAMVGDIFLHKAHVMTLFHGTPSSCPTVFTQAQALDKLGVQGVHIKNLFLKV